MAYVAFSVQRQVVLPPLPFSLYCTRGTCASSLVRSHTSRSPGARHLRACPVREVVTVTWDPRPREPVEGVLRATSVLELAATRRTLELRGKRWLGQWRVSHLQSSRGWSGTPRTVRSSTRRRPASPSSHCLAPYGPGTVWRGQAWDRSPARLRRLLLLYLCPTSL